MTKSGIMGNKSNFYKKPFFITKKSIPFWVGSVSSAIALIFFFGSYFEIEDESHAISFLSINAELLVTILAVTMSFTLLGLQYLAESYTPRALGTYLKDKVIYGFPILYVTLISLNLFSVTFPKILHPIEFIQYAFVGTIFSLVYLIAFIYYVIGKIQPEKVMADTAKNVQAKDWKIIVENKGQMNISSAKFRPFIIFEQTMLKAVNTNDIFSFVQGINFLFKLLNDWLEEIYKEFETNEKTDKENLENIEKYDEYKNVRKLYTESDYVYSFFFRLFSQLFAECVTHYREQFIIQYQSHLFEQIMKMHEHKNVRAMDDFWDQIDYIGQKIFELEMISASDAFIRNTKLLMNKEFETIKITKQDWARDAMGFRKKHSKEQIDLESISRDMSSDQLDSLKKFGIIAASKKLEKPTRSIIWNLDDLLSDSVTLTDGTTRRSLVYSITKCISEIHRVSVDNGLKYSLISYHIDHYVEKMDRRYVQEIENLVKGFCKMTLYSIEHGEYFDSHQLGFLSRHFADSYPNLVLITLDALEKTYDILSNEKDQELRESWSNEVIRDIESAEEWNKKNHKIITEKVITILTSIKNLINT